MGIGSAPNQKQASSRHSTAKAGNLSMKEVEHRQQEGSNSSLIESQQQQQQQPPSRKRSKPKHKDWASVPVEEDLQVRQCLSQVLTN